MGICDMHGAMHTRRMPSPAPTATQSRPATRDGPVPAASPCRDTVVEVTATIASAFLCFWVAEEIAGVSGVLAVVTLAIFMAAIGKYAISPDVGVRPPPLPPPPSVTSDCSDPPWETPDKPDRTHAWP